MVFTNGCMIFNQPRKQLNMTDTVLEINGLSRSYGSVKALTNLSLSVNKGSVFGLLGPNGSGKTTTLGILLNILHKDSGTFSWFGNGDADENRLRIGAILETPNFYPYLSAKQNLRITGHIKKVENIEAAINRVIEQVGLIGRENDKFKTYSLGMKQRLAIASALINDPEILVLDEPTNGLDPEGIADIRTLISNIGKTGKTIIIASHILDEIEKICSHVAIMRKGVLLSSGTLDEILGNGTSITIASENMDALRTAIGKINWISITEDNVSSLIVAIDEDKTSTHLNRTLMESGVTLSEINVSKKKLESIFLETVQND